MKNLCRALCFMGPSILVGAVKADDRAEILTLLEQYAQSVNVLDLELARSIWSQADDISFIHPRGHQVGWEDIRQLFYIDAMGRFASRNLELRDISIRLLNEDAAWGDFYWDFDAVLPDGSALQSAGRETQVWAKESGAWRIVHVHYSGMPVTGEREGF